MPSIHRCSQPASPSFEGKRAAWANALIILVVAWLVKLAATMTQGCCSKADLTAWVATNPWSRDVFPVPGGPETAVIAPAPSTVVCQSANRWAWSRPYNPPMWPKWLSLAFTGFSRFQSTLCLHGPCKPCNALRNNAGRCFWMSSVSIRPSNFRLAGGVSE